MRQPVSAACLKQVHRLDEQGELTERAIDDGLSCRFFFLRASAQCHVLWMTNVIRLSARLASLLLVCRTSGRQIDRAGNFSVFRICRIELAEPLCLFQRAIEQCKRSNHDLSLDGMSEIRSLKPNVTRDQAIRQFSLPVPSSLLRDAALGRLRSVAELYIPFRLFRVNIVNRGVSEKSASVQRWTPSPALWTFINSIIHRRIRRPCFWRRAMLPLRKLKMRLQWNSWWQNSGAFSTAADSFACATCKSPRCRLEWTFTSPTGLEFRLRKTRPRKCD